MRLGRVLAAVSVLAACNPPSERPPVATSQQGIDSAAAAVRTRDSLAYVRWNLPRLASTVLGRDTLAARYDLFLGLNPYYQRGLLDGDTIPDVAVQILERATGKRGIAIIHGVDSTVHILGAGTAFGTGGDDFKFLWVWRVEPRGEGADSLSVGRDVLYLEKPESAGANVSWNGSRYVGRQHGD